MRIGRCLRDEEAEIKKKDGEKREAKESSHIASRWAVMPSRELCPKSFKLHLTYQSAY